MNLDLSKLTLPLHEYDFCHRRHGAHGWREIYFYSNDPTREPHTVRDVVATTPPNYVDSSVSDLTVEGDRIINAAKKLIGTK